jgi:hypothetical protein
MDMKKTIYILVYTILLVSLTSIITISITNKSQVFGIDDFIGTYALSEKGDSDVLVIYKDESDKKEDYYACKYMIYSPYGDVKKEGTADLVNINNVAILSDDMINNYLIMRGKNETYYANEEELFQINKISSSPVFAE